MSLSPPACSAEAAFGQPYRGGRMGIVRVTIAALQTSIFLVVCGLGLKTDLGDVLFLFQRRSLLARSLLAMNVAMPLLAMLIAIAFDLPVPVQVAVLFLAPTPVPLLARQGTVLALAGFVICGMAFGHWSGRPEHADRTTLALATAARRPGMAISIAAAAFQRNVKRIAAIIVLYLLTKLAILIPCNAWRKRTRPLVQNRNFQSNSV